MSVQNLPPGSETSAEPEDLTIRRLVRALDFAEGFWLGFVKSNTRAQRRRLAALCKDLLAPLKIRLVEIELTEPVTDLLPLLQERLAQERGGLTQHDADAGGAHVMTDQPKLAIFVYGLEHSIPSKEAHPPLLSSLNLKRELFRQQVPCPLVIWLPDYALTALARKAPDFWAWRSGLYEFAPERESADQSYAEVSDEALHVTSSLSEGAKRQRLAMLKGLLDDYRELGNNPREQMVQASILHEIGLVHEMLGEWPDANEALEESLAISRKLKNKGTEATTLHALGILAQDQGKHVEAQRFHNESLKIAKRLGNQCIIAYALHELGRIAHYQGEHAKAQRFYDESLKINKGLYDQSSVAYTLQELGRLAQTQGKLSDARRLYNEGLEIMKEFGDQRGIAIILRNLGALALDEGDKEEAARLFSEALSIYERLGSPNAETTRQILALVES